MTTVPTTPSQFGASDYPDRGAVRVPVLDEAAVAATVRPTWWSAIGAGTLTAIALQVILTVLGAAVGLSVVGSTDDTPEGALSVGAGLWWLVTGLVSLFMGGWVAGRLCPVTTRFIGTMHGFLMWTTVTVFSALLVTMAGGSVLAGSLGIVASASANNPRAVEQFARDRIGMMSQPYGTNAGSAAGSANTRYDQGATQDTGVARTEATGTGAASATPNTNVTNSSSYGSTGYSAGPYASDRPLDDPQAKDAAANAAAASWWTFIALAMGAAVSAAGGAAGTRCKEAHFEEGRVAV
jgi:hypothetical protein